MLCPHCNESCESHDLYCKYCGKPLTGSEQQPDFSPNEDETVGYFSNQEYEPIDSLNPENFSYYEQNFSQSYNQDYNQAYNQDYNQNYNQDYNQDYNQNYNQDYNQNYNQGNPQRAPAFVPVVEPPRKSKAPLIIGLACGGLVLAVIILLVALSIRSNGNSQDNTSLVTESSTTESLAENSQFASFILRQRVNSYMVDMTQPTLDFIKSSPIFSQKEGVRYQYSDWSTQEVLLSYDYNSPELIMISDTHIIDVNNTDEYATISFAPSEGDINSALPDSTYFVGFCSKLMADQLDYGHLYSFALVPIMQFTDSLNDTIIVCAIGDCKEGIEIYESSQFAKVTTKNNNLLIRSSMEIIGSRVKDNPNNIVGSAEKDSYVEVLFVDYDSSGEAWAYIRCYYNVLTGGPYPKGSTVEGYAKIYSGDYYLLTFE